MQAEHYIESVLSKCAALKESGIWAPEPHVRPEAWLNNFSDPLDRLLAAVVLDNFIFYSDRASARLLANAYHRLEDDALLGRLRTPSGTRIDVDALFFSPVEGEHPRPTDSGNTVCKRLRDTLELPDERFLNPATALEQARAGRTIVFVDDIVGSGQQLMTTWKRPYRSDPPLSFEEAYAAQPFAAFCLAIVATETALSNIATDASPISVVATHVLDASYSIERLEAPAITPPIPDFPAALQAFLARHASTLTLDHFLQTGRQPLYGFHDLGLLFAIQGGVPDCTVPIVWAAGPAVSAGSQEWIRLVRKNV